MTLRLVTPRGVAAALGLFGLHWAPQPWVKDTPTNTDFGVSHGLYAWCDGQGPAETDTLDRGVLYFGIGRSAEGVIERLRQEYSWIEGAEHGHGLAMGRRLATPVVGPITAEMDSDLQWLDELVEAGTLTAKAPGEVRTWLQDTTSTPVQKAEQLAIRFSIHAGDVVAPVNSQFAGSWATNRPADWAGYVAAVELRQVGGQPT